MSEAFQPVDPRDRGLDNGTISAFVPLLILGLVLVAWFAFQAVQLRVERDAMTELAATQEKQVQESKKLRDSLDAIARGTAQLAESGNANAKLIVDELKKRGITITPNAAPSQSGTPEPAK